MTDRYLRLGQEPVSKKIECYEVGGFPEAYHQFNCAIIEDNWPTTHVNALSDLFYELGAHPYSARGILDKRALLTYCENMRRKWDSNFEADVYPSTLVSLTMPVSRSRTRRLSLRSLQLL